MIVIFRDGGAPAQMLWTMSQNPTCSKLSSEWNGVIEKVT